MMMMMLMLMMMMMMSASVCVSDEGPYTKHSAGSRTPDGALAIRRQSIPGKPAVSGLSTSPFLSVRAAHT